VAKLWPVKKVDWLAGGHLLGGRPVLYFLGVGFIIFQCNIDLHVPRYMYV